MSRMLCNGTEPNQLYTKVHSGPKGGIVVIGDYRLSMADFIDLVEYALTNTDLGRGDPRRKLVERVKKLVQIEGYNPGGKRLEFADAAKAMAGTRQPGQNSRRK